jgi:YjbE family integral membrane protein
MKLTAEFASDASTFLQVVFIDTVPAGDNAVVVAMAAAHVPRQYRRRVIIGGISGALVLRIVLGLTATRLLDIVGLTLAGGLRLLWVCWKMLHDVLDRGPADDPARLGRAGREGAGGIRRAILQVLVAGISMSVDNILAIAGAARDPRGFLSWGWSSRSPSWVQQPVSLRGS